MKDTTKAWLIQIAKEARISLPDISVPLKIKDRWKVYGIISSHASKLINNNQRKIERLRTKHGKASEATVADIEVELNTKLQSIDAAHIEIFKYLNAVIKKSQTPPTSKS